MNLGFKITEKIIACFLITLGCLIIYLLINLFNTIMKDLQFAGIMEQKAVLLLRFIKNRNALILMGLADISAGILLVLSKKAAWVIAMIALLTEMLVPL